MIDKNGHEFFERKGFFMTKVSNKFYVKFIAGGDKAIPSLGFKDLKTY